MDSDVVVSVPLLTWLNGENELIGRSRVNKVHQIELPLPATDPERPVLGISP